MSSKHISLRAERTVLSISCPQGLISLFLLFFKVSVLDLFSVHSYILHFFSLKTETLLIVCACSGDINMSIIVVFMAVTTLCNC